MPENEEREKEDKLHQFQRNKYFYGKLMTVRDFELEQEYFNGKRHLLNRLIHGKGLLYGFADLELSPRGSDELDILFRDGGVALDFLGREIVVPEDTKKNVLNENGSPLKKSELKGTIYLYLRYSLSPSELIRAASNPLSCDEITCPNRILEDFDVIASYEHPVEKENERESLSYTEFAEVDEKVFFAAFNQDLSLNEEKSFYKHYLHTQREETSKKISATGVVHFMQPTMNSITSELIDPELGEDPFVQLGLETEENEILIDYYEASIKNRYPKLQLGTILDTSSGKFTVQVVFADESERRSIKVRWWAYRAGMHHEPVYDIKHNVSLTKYKFVSRPEVRAKFVENGLCESGAKNFMKDGIISGGDHYARRGNYVALNGNPKKLAELIKEQDDEPKDLLSEWDIGGGWRLKVDNFDSTLKQPVVKIRLYYEEKEMKSFNVSKGELITYCEDIAGETGVPLFVTYIDDIYIPIIRSLIGKEAKVVLKYTWAVSKKLI